MLDTWDDVITALHDTLVIRVEYDRHHDLDDGAVFFVHYIGDEPVPDTTVVVTLHDSPGWVPPRPTPSRYRVSVADAVYADWVQLDDLPDAIAGAFIAAFQPDHVTPFSCDACGRDAIDRHHYPAGSLDECDACDDCARHPIRWRRLGSSPYAIAIKEALGRPVEQCEVKLSSPYRGVTIDGQNRYQERAFRQGMT